MAFIRKETRKSGNYLRVVESYRDADGKSRHRTLYNLGKAQDYSPESFKKMGQVLYELGGGPVEELESKQLKEKGRYYYGFPLIVRKLLKEYSLDRFLQRRTINSGMMNSDNILEAEAEDYEYIIGERIENISRAKQDEILDIEKYQTITVLDENSGQEIEIKYHITSYKNKKLITTYSNKRAARDKTQREEKIEKAKRLLHNPSQLEKKAKYHYLKKQGKNTYILDEDKIRNSERFDGFLSVATNNKNLSVSQILDAYKQLYKIGQSFRSFKTFLETRPMYHWTKKRILGHLALCYISFTLLNHLQLRLRQNMTPLTEGQIRKSLTKMQVSLIQQNKVESIEATYTPVDHSPAKKCSAKRDFIYH